MTYKVILSGRLEFGNARSCEKAMQLFQNRFDIIYRTDVFLKLEEVFQVEHSCLDVYRFSAQVTEKTWNNTTKLLEEVTHFAIAGKLDAWLTENGQVLQYCVIEPHTEKTAVRAFLHGRDLINDGGKELEAIGSLNEAIEKYERHAPRL
jgi:hypothetical protein